MMFFLVVFDGKRDVEVHFRQYILTGCSIYSSIVFREVPKMEKLRLQHISCSIPVDGQEEIRAFYGGVLGLEEKPSPKALADRNVVWFKAGENEMELHFTPDPILADPLAQYHFCLEVAELEQYRVLLIEADYIISEAIPILNRPRFFCRDPLNNLVEFTTIQGSYEEDL